MGAFLCNFIDRGLRKNPPPAADQPAALQSRDSFKERLSIGDSVSGLRVSGLLQADGEASTSLDDLRGSIVVLEFWATWCGPCVAAIGHLNDVADELRTSRNVQFISVTDEGPEIVCAFLAQKPIHTWISIDEERNLHRAFGVSGIPKTIVFNAEGIVAACISPMQLDSEVVDRIKQEELIEALPSRAAIVAGVDLKGDDDAHALMKFVLRESTNGLMRLSATIGRHKGRRDATLLGLSC